MAAPPWAPPGFDPVAMLAGRGTPAPHRHYPAGDVYDMASHAQFYWHSHRVGEQGHIHLFQRPRGMPAGIGAPLVPTGEADAPCHIIAVSVGTGGRPERLFTTNRWVTGEAWYPAEAVKLMAARLRLSYGGRYGAACRWVAGLAAFYLPLIEALLDERDAAVAERLRSYPGRDVLEDQRLEILSWRDVDLAADWSKSGD